MSETTGIVLRDGVKMGVELMPPRSGRGVGIIFVPAIFGIDDGMREIMSDWAARGAVACAVDPFHRTIPGPLGREAGDRDKAQKRYAEFDAEQGVADMADAIAWLRKHPSCNRKVVVFGYCFGGRYAFLAVARGLADGAVSFHGTKIGLNLNEAGNVAAPLSIHVGDNDRSIPMDEVEATKRALNGNRFAEIHVYPGVEHGFTGKGRPAYNAHADRSSTEAAARIVRGLAARESAAV